MNLDDQKQLSSQPKDELCVSCKRFFGNSAFQNMCSQCYKSNKSLVTPKKEEQHPQTSPIQEVCKDQKQEKKEEKEEKKLVNKDRCATCNRKLKLLGIECRCGSFYCNVHRLPETHECSFNHQSLAKQKLTKEMNKVQNGKIQSI